MRGWEKPIGRRKRSKTMSGLFKSELEVAAGAGAVVPLSLFSRQYLVSKELRKTFGLYNGDIRAICRAEFEQLKHGMKDDRVKRQREECSQWHSNKRPSQAESLEGNTLASSYPYELSHTIILSSDVPQGDMDQPGVWGSHVCKQILVSDDIEETENTNGRVETEARILYSAGSLVSTQEAPRFSLLEQRPHMLLSDAIYDKDSSPPLLDW